MKNVIIIPEITGKEKESKGVEFTHVLSGGSGWSEEKIRKLSETEKIVYLGKCRVDGDMFAVYTLTNIITIYKGHLNNGTF